MATTIKRVKPNPQPEKPKAKVIKLNGGKTTVKDKSKEVIEKVTPVNKANLIEKVISNRQVKYVYPPDVNDTLSRKSWRQTVRNKLESLEMTMLKIKDQNSKEYKAAKKAFEDYQSSVMKAI